MGGERLPPRYNANVSLQLLIIYLHMIIPGSIVIRILIIGQKSTTGTQ